MNFPLCHRLTFVLGALLTVVLGCSSLKVAREVEPSGEKRSFSLSNGSTATVQFFPADSSKSSQGTVFFIYGSFEGRSSHGRMLHWLLPEGYNLLSLECSQNLSDCVEAGVAATEWLHKNKDPRPLILYGHNIGGPVVLRLAQKVSPSLPLRNVIMEAGFSTFKKLPGSGFARGWSGSRKPFTRFEENHEYSPAMMSEMPRIPLLFIHGSEDRSVDIKNTEAMYAAALSPKEIWIIPSGSHGDLYELRGGELRRQFLAYLSKTSTSAP